MAKLYFRYGAMNSGKSTALMQVAFNYEERNMKVKIAKPYVDTKGASFIVSRLGIKREVDYMFKGNDNIFDTIKNESKFDCLLIDEVQFLKETQIDELLLIATKLNIPVICYGLRTDFLMNGFKASERLLLIAHSLEELKTICACGKKAMFNGRKLNDKFVFSGSQIAIEGEVFKYESLCAKCYYKYRKEEDGY